MNLSKKWLSSEHCAWQVLGAIIRFKCVGMLLLAFFLFAYAMSSYHNEVWFKLVLCTSATCVFLFLSQIINTLAPIFCLRRKETHITWSQIVLLLAFGAWITTIVMVIDVSSHEASSYVMVAAGFVLSWAFQDTIKSVAAFFYLRYSGLLRIGDWIQVDSRGIDGMVRNISLTTVVLENWDTTTSAFPIYILNSDHFRNNQRMVDGRTLGRLMKRSFIIDTGWIRCLDANDVVALRNRLTDVDDCFKNDVIKEGELNIHVFRMYIYYWLMNRKSVSHEPRLLVRWLEHISEGLPLQVYAFIINSSLAAFEREQSLIIEHVVKSMSWFDLQLYQSPSGYDASNSNIHLTDKEADYRKGDLQ
ncbi:MAG: mechanosensitive ion channel domain-containing protein [Muribaculaceae bacterium]